MPTRIAKPSRPNCPDGRVASRVAPAAVEPVAADVAGRTSASAAARAEGPAVAASGVATLPGGIPSARPGRAPRGGVPTRSGPTGVGPTAVPTSARMVRNLAPIGRQVATPRVAAEAPDRVATCGTRCTASPASGATTTTIDRRCLRRGARLGRMSFGASADIRFAVDGLGWVVHERFDATLEQGSAVRFSREETLGKAVGRSFRPEAAEALAQPQPPRCFRASEVRVGPRHGAEGLPRRAAKIPARP